MTREEWCCWARTRFEALAAISLDAADEARRQAGLPEVFVWTTMSANSAFRLAIACHIRLLEARQ